METNTKASLKMESSMDLEFTNLMTADYILANGRIIKWMERVSLNGLMAQNILGHM